MSLYNKYRPLKFDEVFGNEKTLESIKKLLKSKDIPHSFLLQGASGTGKTTLARIISNELKVHPNDIIEVDSAQFRGIDKVREIKQNSKQSALYGKIKVYILDECFHKDTLVTLGNGDKKRIKDVYKGETVQNLNGTGKVTNTFINKIPLDRLCKVTIGQDKIIYCSDKHEFFTNEGWVFAKDLKNKIVFLNNCSTYEKNKSKKEVSKCVQNRCGEHIETNSNRSRWKGTQYEKTKKEGFEKNKSIAKVRVESVEIYKQGSNEQSFKSIIKNKERKQQYIELYDLEINNHHSFYANDVLVHNCHMATKEAQTGLLKVLEDTPKHVYFFLCTTDPQKLLPTIRSRCMTYEMSLLDDETMTNLLKNIVKKENDKVKGKVIEQIVKDSLGHPRNAVNILQRVLSVDEKQRLSMAKQAADEESEAIALCRLLIKDNTNWASIGKVLKGLKKTDVESIRRIMMGYATTVLLDKNHFKAGVILEAFNEPFFDTGFPQLVYACYFVYTQKA